MRRNSYAKCTFSLLFQYGCVTVRRIHLAANRNQMHLIFFKEILIFFYH